MIERPRLPKRVDNRRLAESYATAELCGWAAARRHQPRESGWNEEGARVCELLLRPWANSYPELCAYVQRFRISARKLVQDPVFWSKTYVIAGQLLTQVRLDGADLIGICQAVEESLR